MLFRFREQQLIESGILKDPKKRIPSWTSEVHTIRECEEVRYELLQEIGRKIQRINDGISSSFLCFYT
jgi:pre-mRNA-splicing factor ISY1